MTSAASASEEPSSSSSFDAHAPSEGFRLKGADKLAFVSEMFDRVAPTYDVLNHFISLGQTTLWRLLALSFLPRYLTRGARVLDVGCGTGWVTWYFKRRYRKLQLEVEGMDCSPARSWVRPRPLVHFAFALWT